MSEAVEIPSSVMTSMDELKEHERNYRSHPKDQLEHIVTSIRENGFYRNVVVAEDGTILAGHGVIEAARVLGLTEVPVVRLPIAADSDQALKVLTGDNYLSHLAENDDRLLAEILRELGERDELLGTGFDKQMVAAFAMVTRPASEIEDFDAAAEWAGAGMPEFDTGGQVRTITVNFLSEEDEESFITKLGGEEALGLVRKKTGGTMWWPKRERNDLDSLEIVTEE